jgi:hypothetical protein
MQGGYIGNTKTGGRYSFANNIWFQAPVEPNTPSARKGHTAIWTGNKMIVFGGSVQNQGAQNTGAFFTPKRVNIVLIPNVFELPDAVFNVPYLQNISAITLYSNSPSIMELVEGTLPFGLTFDGSSGIGVISGTPVGPAVPFPYFTITATDENFCSGSRTYFINFAFQ